MANEANRVIDGLTVVGTLALGNLGDADKALLSADLNGNLAVNGAAVAFDPDRTDDSTCVESFSRYLAGTSAGMNTQGMRTAFFYAPRTITVSTMSFVSGSTATTTPTLVRLGLYSVSGTTCTLVASTANDTTLLGATNTPYNKSLSASYTMQSGTLYCAALLVVAAAAGTVRGVSLGWNGATAYTPRLGGELASQADLPASFATGSLTAGGVVPWFRLA